MADYKILGDVIDTSGVKIDSILKVYHTRLKRLWRDSVRVFVLAMSSKMQIDTGMSIASLAPLGAQIRLQKLILEITRGRGPRHGTREKARRGYTDINGSYHPSQFKSRAHGKALGQSAYDLEFGSPTAPDLLFSFKIVVFQHKFHEPDWKSLEAGKEAFREFFEINFSEYIKVDDLLGRLLGV